MLKNIFVSMKRYFLPRLIAYTAKYGLRLLLSTCRVEIRDLDHFITTAEQFPCILMLWHNRMAPVAEIMTKRAPQFIYNAFISKSRDGEALAILTESYSVGRVLRVPHNARHQALGKMINTLKAGKEVMIVTPDGPRGPSGVVKPGIIVAAREASAMIVPMTWEGDRYWELKTWDRMRIPKPFSKIVFSFGEAIKIPQETSENFAVEAQMLAKALT